MSRGLGSLQRTILGNLPLDGAWAIIDTLAPSDTRAQQVSIRRAIHRLAAQGYIELGQTRHHGGGGRPVTDPDGNPIPRHVYHQHLMARLRRHPAA